MVTKKVLCKFLWFYISFSNNFETIGRTLTCLCFFLFSGLFFLKAGVTFAFFRLPGNSSVVSAWLKSCCNISAETIALVFNTFSGIFLWVVAFLTFKFFISFSISDWETSANENLFPWKILPLLSKHLDEF